MFPSVEAQLEKIARGVVEIYSREELVEKLERSRRENRPLRVKLGIDPTSPDIHLGHGVPLRKLRHFQELGHTPVLIIGDYTALVGDPSGRNSTRPQLSREEIEVNARTYVEQAGKILDMSRVEVVRNSQWFERMSFEEVIRLAAKMTVARLIERDDFARRYRAGNPIALHEFLYPMMQGYDSVMVRSDVEIGATEQTFNLLVGRDLQRDAGMEPQVAITLPILIGTDGVRKMSKSLGNYIGVTESPEMMYGKVMSIPDVLMRDYFILATDVPLAEVEALLAGGDPMAAKMALARAIVTRYHGEDVALRAEEYFERTVRWGEVPENIPRVEVPPALLREGRIWIVRLLVHCGLASSNSEARRLISQGAVSLDGDVITDPDLDLSVRGGMVLRAGKRRYVRLEVS